jgi:hypothetical protein
VAAGGARAEEHPTGTGTNRLVSFLRSRNYLRWIALSWITPETRAAYPCLRHRWSRPHCPPRLTTRARGLPTSRHQHPLSDCLAPGRLCAFVGGRKDPEITTGRYPTTSLANRGEIQSPRLRRLGSGAREALRLLGTFLGSVGLVADQGEAVGGMSKTALQLPASRPPHLTTRARGLHTGSPRIAKSQQAATHHTPAGRREILGPRLGSVGLARGKALRMLGP